jgi:hypothetical protein
MTFAIIGGLAGAAAGAAGLGGLTLATGGMLGLAAGSAIGGSRAAKSAGETQAAAADRAANLQQQQYEQTRQDLEPWRKAGVNALGKLEGMADYTPFSMDTFSQDPGYGFRLAEGRKALASKARARGGLVSGQTLKGMQDYAQESASQEYSNAFNRYQIERAAKLGPYQSLANVGQTSANQLGQFGAANAANVGNLMTGGAAAQAAGQVGQANAITGGLGSYLNYTQSNNLLNALNQNRGSTYGYTPTTDYSTGANYTLGGRLGVDQ